MLVWEIRERLVRDGVCKPTALPSLSTLTRMLRDADSGTDESNLSNERTTTTTTTTTMNSNEDLKEEKSKLMSFDFCCQ